MCSDVTGADRTGRAYTSESFFGLGTRGSAVALGMTEGVEGSACCLQQSGVDVEPCQRCDPSSRRFKPLRYLIHFVKFKKMKRVSPRELSSRVISQVSFFLPNRHSRYNTKVYSHANEVVLRTTITYMHTRATYIRVSLRQSESCLIDQKSRKLTSWELISGVEALYFTLGNVA